MFFFCNENIIFFIYISWPASQEFIDLEYYVPACVLSASLDDLYSEPGKSGLSLHKYYFSLYLTRLISPIYT